MGRNLQRKVRYDTNWTLSVSTCIQHPLAPTHSVALSCLSFRFLEAFSWFLTNQYNVLLVVRIRKRDEEVFIAYFPVNSRCQKRFYASMNENCQLHLHQSRPQRPRTLATPDFFEHAQSAHFQLSANQI